MKASDLRNAVLQLAIQGKLVPQDQNDEPASVLFKRIKVEKEQLIKAGKVKREKALPEITEEEKPFEIPESWEWVRLKEICFNFGQKKPDSRFTYIDVGSIDNKNGVLSNKYQELEPNEAPSRARKIVQKGSVIYSTVRPYLLNICIIDREFDYEPIVSTAFGVLHPLNGIEKEFLFYYLRSDIFVKYVNAQMIGVAYPAINDENLFKGLFPLPPTEEQKRIVAKIEEIMPKIDEYEKVEKELSSLEGSFPDNLRKSILQYAVQGKLVQQDPEDEPASVLVKRIKAEKEQLIKEGKIKRAKALPETTDNEKPFEIPDSWEWTSINQIAFVTKLAGFEYTDYIAKNIMPNDDVPIVRAQNIKMNRFISNIGEFISLELSEKLNRSALYKKCLLITFIGAGIGEVAMFNEKKRYHLAPNVAKIELFNNFSDKINNKYILFYLMSPIGQSDIFRFLKSTAQPSLSMETIRQVRVPLPPLAEQQRIVDKVEKLMALCDKLKIVS